MKLQARSNTVIPWLLADEKLIKYYFGTTDEAAILSRFGKKKVIKVMNLHFRVAPKNCAV